MKKDTLEPERPTSCAAAGALVLSPGRSRRGVSVRLAVLRRLEKPREARSRMLWRGEICADASSPAGPGAAASAPTAESERSFSMNNGGTTVSPPPAPKDPEKHGMYLVNC